MDRVMASSSSFVVAWTGSQPISRRMGLFIIYGLQGKLPFFGLLILAALKRAVKKGSGPRDTSMVWRGQEGYYTFLP